jgi:NAD(P)-dependent dehydrogenase (short-subunit alcohol dehydrogenase family)
LHRLEGKVILVAGAGVIGNACALRYASEGASVVLGDVRTDVAQEAADEIKRAGGEARAVRLDGADEASIAAAVEFACATYGGLDGLHANFARAIEGRLNLLDVPIEMYEEIMQVNARGFFLCTRLAVPHLIARGGGAIVYTSSGAATKGGDSRVAYAMSKAAGQALMRHVAIKFGPQGVRANAIAPGVIERPNTRQEIKDLGMRDTRIPRLGHAGDIASMCALLMSDEGSYITGQVINIDGGITMRP